MRFARLQELAEEPLLVFPAGAGREALRAIQQEIEKRTVGRKSSFMETQVGPTVGGDSLRLEVGLAHGSNAPLLMRELTEPYGRGLNRTAIDHLTSNPLFRAAMVSFGWDKGGFAQPDRLSLASQEMKKLNFNYKEGLSNALAGLLEHSKEFEPGDVLRNFPLGADQGDFRRANAYSRYGGFGPLTDRFGQDAVLDSGLRPTPALLGRAHQLFAVTKGWRPPEERFLSKEEADEVIAKLRERLDIPDLAAFMSPPKFRPVPTPRPVSARQTPQGQPAGNYNQLGIPGVSRDLLQWETLQQSRVTPVPQVDDFTLTAEEMEMLRAENAERNYLRRHGDLSVIPGLRERINNRHLDVWEGEIPF